MPEARDNQNNVYFRDLELISYNSSRIAETHVLLRTVQYTANIHYLFMSFIIFVGRCSYLHPSFFYNLINFKWLVELDLSCMLLVTEVYPCGQIYKVP